MNQTEEMQEQLDGVFYKAVSRILFYPDSHRLRYANCLASMVSAISQGNTIIFREAHEELMKSLEQLPNTIQQGQKDLIGFFEGKYIPLNQRMQYLEMQVNKMGKLEKDINMIRNNVKSKFSREAMKKYIEQHNAKSLDKKALSKDVSDIPKTKEPRPVHCPNGHVVMTRVAKGKDTCCRKCDKNKNQHFKITE